MLLLWLVVLLACLAIAELGHVAGFVGEPVVRGLSGPDTDWWRRSAIFHFGAFGCLLGLVVLAGRSLSRRLPRLQSRAARILAVVIVLLGVVLCLNQFAEMRRVVSQVTDFGTIYAASRALFGGGDPYAATDNAYFYPPLLSFLFGSLIRLTPAGASLLFFSVKMVLVVWALAACDRLVSGERFNGGRRVLFSLGMIFVAARFWIADLQFGNTNVLIMFLVIASIAMDHDQRPLPAGLALALAISIKIIPGVLCVHYLCRRRWRTLAITAVTVLGLNLMPWFLLRDHWWSAWESYHVAGVAGKLSLRLSEPDNQSLWGVINRTFPNGSIADLRIVWLAASLLLVSFAGLVSRVAIRREPMAHIASAALYPLLGLLVSPGSWVVHYTATLLPMTTVWMLALSRQWSGRISWPLFLAANLAFTMSGWARITVRASTTQSWFVLATVLLVVGLGAWVLTRPVARHDSCAVEIVSARTVQRRGRLRSAPSRRVRQLMPPLPG
ncbi:MAG: DUF2029 domain-containing protein [bacterium]|nr:DUF2029 domain-containing protein [bacterium]